ncbi:MAG: hypothetical protein GC154_17070 [bacterium]|nr:hypothetical protein [bacterium]
MRKRVFGIVLLAGVLALMVSAHAASAAELLTDLRKIIEGFPQRQHDALTTAAGSTTSAAPIEGAALLFAGEQTAAANQLIENVTVDECGLMEISVLLRLALASGNLASLTDSARDNAIRVISGFLTKHAGDPPLPLAPESGELLQLTTLYLWTQYARQNDPSLVESDTKFPSLSDQETALMQWLGQRVEFGFEERGSAYAPHLASALLLLRDAASSDAIRMQAEACLDLLVADLAPVYFGGLPAGPRLRSLEAIAPSQDDWIPFLWFGEQNEDPPQSVDASTIHLAVSSYRPPAALIRIAIEREDRGSYEVKHRYFLPETGGESLHEGRSYAFVDPNFVLGSFVLHNQAVPWQSRPWDLMIWDGRGSNNRVFSFAGRQLFSGARPPYTDEFFGWNASVYQYRNVLYCRYLRSDRKRPGDPLSDLLWDRRYVQQPARVWISETLNPVEEDGGWWFCRLGRVYVAFRPVQGRGFWWRSVETEARDSSASILTLQDLDSGLLIEVEQADRFMSFDRFKQQVIAAPLIVERDSITFVSRRGDVFLFPLKEGEFLVNGRPVDPWRDPDYSLYSSKFIKGGVGEEPIEAEWPPFSLRIDRSDPARPRREIHPDLSADQPDGETVMFPHRP